MTGWTALTLHFKESENPDEHLSDVEEKLDEYDKVHYSDEDIAKLLFSGYGRHREAVNLIEELRNALKEHQIVIDANDTTDSGDGTVYKVYEFGSRSKTDVYPCEIEKGEQPERGHDVALKIQTKLETDFTPYSGR